MCFIYWNTVSSVAFWVLLLEKAYVSISYLSLKLLIVSTEDDKLHYCGFKKTLIQMWTCVLKTRILPSVLLSLRTVCWWCLHCWPTWSDKSCSTLEAEAALEASHLVFSAAGKEETSISVHFFPWVCGNNCEHTVLFALQQQEKSIQCHFYEITLVLHLIQYQYGGDAGFLESWEDLGFII